MKVVGNIISAIIMILIAVFCFYVVAKDFSVLFLLLGLGTIGFAGYTLFKTFKNSSSSTASDDFEF